MSDWFNTGQSAVDAATRSGGGGDFSSFRFYLKQKQDAVVAFCDGDNTEAEPVGHYKEHTFSRRDTRAPGFSSCSRGTGKDCPLCVMGLRPYDAWPFTIIQIKPTWTDKDGKEHGNQKKLLVVKRELMQRVLRAIELRRGLTGTIWRLFRSPSKTSYTVGDDWQFDRKVDGGRAGLAKDLGVNADLVQPLNYVEVLRPKTLEELQAMGADLEATRRREAEWAEKDRGRDGDGGRGDSGGPRGGDGGGGREGDGGGDRRSAGVRY